MRRRGHQTRSEPRRAAAGSGLSRRAFGGLAAGALAAPALAQASARVVVVGAGAGGATAARYLAQNGKALSVTLVNESDAYTSCFFSNLYLAGFRSLSSLTHDVAEFARRYGVAFRQGRAVEIDRSRRRVVLGDGTVLPYDRLVLSPGIGIRFDAFDGYDRQAAARMPHAYRAGPQARALRRYLTTMRPGGLFVIAPPPNPYRCPPGPYERVSMAANLFSRVNPRAKILVIDAKDSFAKRELFLETWRDSYPGMVEWLPASLSGGIAAVRADEMTLITGDGERLTADAACVIPPQTAAFIVVSSGLADASGWAPVDGRTMRSTIDDAVYILGDSSKAGDMPKSAFAANSQAHVVDLAVRSDLEGSRLFPARYRNTCWSFLDYQNVVKIGANYRAEGSEIRRTDGFVSELGETAAVRLENALEANSWYTSITADMYS